MNDKWKMKRLPPVEEATEYVELVTDAPGEVTEPTAETVESETTAVVAVDYTPVIWDATSVLASVILAGALMVVGCLIAFKLWEVPHK